MASSWCASDSETEDLSQEIAKDYWLAPSTLSQEITEASVARNRTSSRKNQAAADELLNIGRIMPHQFDSDGGSSCAADDEDVADARSVLSQQVHEHMVGPSQTANVFDSGSTSSSSVAATHVESVASTEPPRPYRTYRCDLGDLHGELQEGDFVGIINNECMRPACVGKDANNRTCAKCNVMVVSLDRRSGRGRFQFMHGLDIDDDNRDARADLDISLDDERICVMEKYMRWCPHNKVCTSAWRKKLCKRHPRRGGDCFFCHDCV